MPVCGFTSQCWIQGLMTVLFSCCFPYSENKVYYNFPKLSRPLIVTTVLVEPYIMERPPSGNQTEPVYEGFVIDVLEKVADILNFKFYIRPVLDGRYGFRAPDGTWDGMIGELIRKEADLAAAPLFVTANRARVVDFSFPFLQVEATVLLQKSAHNTIKTVDDLVKQNKIQYGTLNTGLIVWSFKTSNNTIYKKLFKNMQNFKPTAFTASNEEGISRVRKGNYAFVIPSTIAEYVSLRNPCDLVTLENFLMERNYAFAVTKWSPILPAINKVLANLKQNGFLRRMYYKWWHYHSDCNGVRSSRIYSANTGPRTSIAFVSLALLSVVLSYPDLVAQFV